MPAIGNSDNAITFSFDTGPKAALDTVALQTAIEAEAGPEGQAPVDRSTDTPELTSRPSQDSTTQQATSEEASSAQVAQTEELKTYKIIVDGQELEVTEADLKAGHMRQRDYTQKTQRIADRERQIAAQEAQWQTAIAQREQELTAIDNFLKDRQLVEAYVQKAFGQAQVQAPQIDPSKPPTVAEVAEIARYNAEQVRLTFEAQRQEDQRQSLARERQAIKQAQDARNEAEIMKHITVLLEKNPLLRRVSENIEDELMGDAARFNPRSLDEVKSKLGEAADRRMANINAIATEQKKQAAVAAAKLKNTSTEPPGGSAPQRQAGKKLTLGSQDRKTLLSENEAYLRDLMAGNS